VLPAAYQTPAAVILLVGGLLSCFAGYRLFRVVLGLYGFILGAAVTTSVMGGSTGTFTLVAAALVGGLVGAVLMVAAYFVGVGLIGAGLAALVLDTGWEAVRHSEPPTVVLVVVAVLGALAALSVVRYVVVVGTALSGSWTTILGALALSAGRAAPGMHAVPAAAANVWVLYPLGPVSPSWWFYAAWLVLAAVGVVVQLSTTTKFGAKKPKGRHA
jgi:hypothetical protein